MKSNQIKYKKNAKVFVFHNYGNYGSILLGHFIKHKHLISEAYTFDVILII